MRNTKSIQSVNHRRQYLYESLQEMVLTKAGVNCRITVDPDTVSIRTKDYTDYIMAKAVIKGRVSQEIVRDSQVLGEKEASEHSTSATQNAPAVDSTK